MTFNEFLDTFDSRLRRDYFRTLGEHLMVLGRPALIVETGCMRPPIHAGHEWEDGQSTLIWDYVARNTGGTCYTVDCNPVNIEYAKAKVSGSTVLVCQDSLKYLASIEASPPVDLLYLDSMDWEGDYLNRAASALHHAGNLPSCGSGWRLEEWLQ